MNFDTFNNFTANICAFPDIIPYAHYHSCWRTGNKGRRASSTDACLMPLEISLNTCMRACIFNCFEGIKHATQV